MAPEADDATYPDQQEPVDEGGDQIRITLRLPEGLKARAEELADEAGQSLNSWLVDAVRDATGSGVRVNLRGQGFNFNYPPRPPRPPHPGAGRRMTGWA